MITSRPYSRAIIIAIIMRSKVNWGNNLWKTEGQYRFFVPFSLLSRDTRSGKLCVHDMCSWWHFKDLSRHSHGYENLLLIRTVACFFKQSDRKYYTLFSVQKFALKLFKLSFESFDLSWEWQPPQIIIDYKLIITQNFYLYILRVLILYYFNVRILITLSNFSINYLKKILSVAKRKIQITYTLH